MIKENINDLKKYNWGLGVEHEMHLFHAPLKSKTKNITDFTLFDSESVVKKLIEEKDNSKIMLNYDEYNFLKSIPFETSGRRCNDKWVIETVPIKMPEFITNQPFCSISKNRDIKAMTRQIITYKEIYYKLMMLDKNTQKLVKKYGELSEYPFGMTRYLKYSLDSKNGKYKFKKDLLVPEYNGSYHITMTLPHKENIRNSKFIKIHQNFCNQLQWLEPLLLTAYFTGDEYAPGTLNKRVRGSFRVMIIGWGNFAGSDVRLFNKGIGRYAKTQTYWRKGLKFIDSNKLKPCFKPSPMAKKENAITSLSSDFRTFGSTDPSRPMHRESGVGMTKPNGIEFRIFDHFSDQHIEHLLNLVGLVAENSRVKETKDYVYKNKVWIKEMHNIMKNGYKAKLSKNYIKLLRSKLGLKIKTTSIIAFDVFKNIYEELWKKNINGKWSQIFHCMDKPKYDNYIFPQINKKGWQFAFMVKLNREKTLLKKFNNLSKILTKLKKINYKDFSSIILKTFGKNWKDDIEDIAYLYESLKYATLKKNIDGTLNEIIINKKINIFKDFNNEIISYFDSSFIENIISESESESEET
jgi:hypothetical protein